MNNKRILGRYASMGIMGGGITPTILTLIFEHKLYIGFGLIFLFIGTILFVSTLGGRKDEYT